MKGLKELSRSETPRSFVCAPIMTCYFSIVNVSGPTGFDKALPAAGRETIISQNLRRGGIQCPIDLSIVE